MAANVDTIHGFLEMWNARDLEAILASMTSDCVYHNMPWEPLVGHAAIRQGLAAFVEDATKIDWQVRHIAEGRDGTILTERVDRFFIRSKWLEIAVMGIFELRGGLISHWRDYFDSAQFQRAMAANP